MASADDEAGPRVRVRAPVGVRVAANVEALRKARGWSQQQLSERMAAIGRPLIVTAVSKVEQGQRRVDVDDLVALAGALGVPPNRLLLADGASDDEIELFPSSGVPLWVAWQWANGGAPLPSRDRGEGWNTDEEIDTYEALGRPRFSRRYDQEPLMVAASRLMYFAQRLIASRNDDGGPGDTHPAFMETPLSKLVQMARRHSERWRFELDAFESDIEPHR